MTTTKGKVALLRLGFFLGLITGTITFFTFRSVPGISFSDAFAVAVLAFLVGLVIGCGITLFLAAFAKKQAGR